MKNTDFYSERKKGIIGTIVFHVVLLLLMAFLGFFTPLPLPGEEGILVNFGDSKNGYGEKTPAPSRKKKPVVTPKKQEPKQTPKKKKTASIPLTPSKPTTEEQTAMTQDYEKTVAINAAEKKREEERKRKVEAEKKRQEKIARKKKEEAERIAREEAERKEREDAERKRKEEEQRKINEINSRTQGAFAKKAGSSNGSGKSQGMTFPGGNQGVKTGSSGANQYGDGGSGSGSQGAGISFSLSGRKALKLPKPKYPGNDAGTVVVKITVDKYGNVTAAEPGARGTTIAGQSFWNEAKQAALKAKFNVNNDAPAFQQGTITYRFVLD